MPMPLLILFQHTCNEYLVTLYTTALLCFPETLYPGGIRTQVFLFLKRMQCPLRHAAKAEVMFIEQDIKGFVTPSPN
jgi:hypothetical protein